LSSHRLAAFPQADQVILLNQGRIQETGTHESLIAAGGAYARLFHAQVRVTRPDLPDHLAFPGEARPEHGR
jgi:ABC-type transport system involved in cytochrome bd biosynthesis fused ATPase/permease subunit